MALGRGEVGSTLRFVKMHGLGNDFIVVEGVRGFLPDLDWGEVARVLCRRRFGVGADGLILVLPSDKADFRMREFNPDGSEAEACGNGLRCFAKFVYEHGLTRKREIEVETLGGIVKPSLKVEGGRVVSVRVDMGPPRLRPSEIPAEVEGERAVGIPIEVGGERVKATLVSMGNPHCVLFVEDIDKAPVRELGPRLERHPIFPNRTNVEFVEVVSPSELRMRVWERGAGETLACGTGACASLVAANLLGKAGRRAVVHLLGGDLLVEWREDGHVHLEGPAEEVFRGEVDLDNLLKNSEKGGGEVGRVAEAEANPPLPLRPDLGPQAGVEGEGGGHN